jgi:hypothetical protein
MPSIGDLLFALAQWLKTTPLPGLALWIATTPLSKAVDTSFWVAATLQTIHILAVAAASFSVLTINLKVLRMAGRSQSLAQTVRRFGPWVWWSLLAMLSTGFLLVMGEPARELLNPCFWTKMVLVAIAALVALSFQESVKRHGQAWELMPSGSLAIRAGAAGVIVLWIAIMLLGRWIAYAPI